MSERLNNLATAHGDLPLPAFLPDATRGVVRCLDAADLAGLGVQGLCVNAFHLSINPGAGVVSAVGGIHRLMGWQGPVLSDSGGFQVYSLLAASPKSGAVTRRGFHYRLEPGGEKKLLTPAKSIQAQFRIRSDIMVCLDHCMHPGAAPEEQARGVEHTLAWAKLCREAFDRLAERTAGGAKLFAVVQGGRDADLRRRCAERLLEIGFDGFGFGGWPVDAEGRLEETVRQVAEMLPPGVPTWALGIGKPEHVVSAAACGYDLFDCVIPTRDARRGRLYAFRADPGQGIPAGSDFYQRLYIHDKKHVRDGSPIDPTCDCPCCRRYSRAYVHHLFHIRDGLAYRLATIHNLRFYMRLFEQLRRDRRRPERP